MNIGYLDCFSGVAGDMWVGAMLDLGLELDALRPTVRALGLAGVEIGAERVLRGGLAGTWFRVAVPPDGQNAHHRHLDDILAILRRARLPSPVADAAEATFRALAEVEAGVHSQPIDKVHFHEVGAEDTIVDIVCACLATHLLGLDRLYASAVTTGSGTVECAHGTMPVPAPGALGNLLGIPLRSGGGAGECVTPTGAALLKTLVTEFEPQLVWTPRAVGYGAGTRDDPGRPNLLRCTIGDASAPSASTALWQVDCNLDTATGEQLGYVLGGLLDCGAVDAFATPVHMKKGRPGYQVTALCDAAQRERVVAFLLEESSSLGVRMHAVERAVLERWTETRPTELGPVVYKVCKLPSGQVVARPEDDEVTRLVREHGISRRAVTSKLARAGAPE